jgi:hypothetical protein
MIVNQLTGEEQDESTEQPILAKKKPEPIREFGAVGRKPIKFALLSPNL